MVVFRTQQKKPNKAIQFWLRFDLVKLKDPVVVDTFQAAIAERFYPLIMMSKSQLIKDAAHSVLGLRNKRGLVSTKQLQPTGPAMTKAMTISPDHSELDIRVNIVLGLKQ